MPSNRRDQILGGSHQFGRKKGGDHNWKERPVGNLQQTIKKKVGVKAKEKNVPAWFCKNRSQKELPLNADKKVTQYNGPSTKNPTCGWNRHSQQ